MKNLPEVDEVIDMVDDPLEVATEEVCLTRFSAIPWECTFRVDGRVAVCEPVREDLIPDRVFHPRRGVEDVNRVDERHTEIVARVIERFILEPTFLGEDGRLVAVMEPEAVTEPAEWWLDSDEPVVILIIVADFLHRCLERAPKARLARVEVPHGRIF